MDTFNQLEAFVQSAQRGSLSQAARALKVTPAMIGRRLDALEARLGVKLLTRTTRQLALTYEGQSFLEEAGRILTDLAHAEAQVMAGGIRARGHVRVSAPAGFGRRHVAPWVGRLLDDNPEVSVSLDLTDRLVDLVNEGVDCAIRIGEMPDSALVSIRLGEMRRAVVGSPSYFDCWGYPLTPADLTQHHCLTLKQQRGWLLREHETARPEFLKVGGRFVCNDGAVLHAWALAGRGLAWRSMWEVADDLDQGRLMTVLDDFAAPPLGIYAVIPHRQHLPVRVRLLVDLLKSAYGDPDYWRKSRH